MSNKIGFPEARLSTMDWANLPAYRHPKPEDLAKEFFKNFSQKTVDDSQNCKNLPMNIDYTGDWAENWDDETEESPDVEKKVLEFISIVAPFQGTAMEPNDPKYDQEKALAQFKDLIDQLSQI